MSYEIVGARDTVKALIALHKRTIACIERGERYYKGRRDVTSTMLRAAQNEIKQCEATLDALEHMSLGSIQRASELLSQIKEFIPHDH